MTAAWVLASAGLAFALVRSPWRRLAENEAAHGWCGGVFALVVLWSLNTGIGNAGDVHLLGVAAYTLVVGPMLALAGAAVALVIACALHHGAWSDLGPAYVATALVPVLVTCAVTAIARRTLARGFLMHVFVEAWLGGALSFTACAALGLASGAIAGPAVADGAGAIALVACLASSEGMLTGMLLTLLLLHRPEWLGMRAAGAPRQQRPPAR